MIRNNNLIINLQYLNVHVGYLRGYRYGYLFNKIMTGTLVSYLYLFFKLKLFLAYTSKQDRER